LFVFVHVLRAFEQLKKSFLVFSPTTTFGLLVDGLFGLAAFGRAIPKHVPDFAAADARFGLFAIPQDVVLVVAIAELFGVDRLVGFHRRFTALALLVGRIP
jgi:hypothetical protein